MLQESFFGKGERPYDETAEDSKTANKKKAAFKRKYQESYLNYGFIATGDSQSPSLLCRIRGDQLPNEAHETFKTASPHRDQAPCNKRQAFGAFQKKGKKSEHKKQKQVLKATTPSIVPALTASLVVAGRTAKAKKPFTIGAALIRPPAGDICRELSEEAAVPKVAHGPFSARTLTNQINEMQRLLRPNC